MLQGDNKELIILINNAIPLPECPIKKADAIRRRAYLLVGLTKYVEKQLENQFNAKQVA